jgi:hypothetical protein
MSETIVRIEPLDSSNQEGFNIVTTVQTIKLAIDSFQSCCGNWGYLFTNDSTEEFIGAEVLGLALTDTSLNLQKLDPSGFYSGSCMFVNIETNKGTLQFVAYNDHNGYYSHDAVVISTQLTHETYL